AGFHFYEVYIGHFLYVFFSDLWNAISSRHPIVKWAQRSDVVFITIDLPDAKNVKLKLEPEGKFFFYAISGADNIPYEVDIDLHDKVDINESKARIGSRNIVYLIKKAESKWWSRLLKQGGKPPIFLRVDWDKWVDEDEQDEKSGPDMDLNDIDFSKLKMGGGGGGGDFNDDDAFDDEGDAESDTEDEKNEAAASASTETPGSAEPDAKT
ncbi:hypothetical protein RJ639_019091, partial [Escallonia herrerae]